MYKELWLISGIWHPGVALKCHSPTHGSPGAMQPCRSRPSPHLSSCQSGSCPAPLHELGEVVLRIIPVAYFEAFFRLHLRNSLRLSQSRLNRATLIANYRQGMPSKPPSTSRPCLELTAKPLEWAGAKLPGGFHASGRTPSNGATSYSTAPILLIDTHPFPCIFRRAETWTGIILAANLLIERSALQYPSLSY